MDETVRAITGLAASRDVALVVSLMVNAASFSALAMLWRSREKLMDKITTMSTELVKELTQLTTTLVAKKE